MPTSARTMPKSPPQPAAPSALAHATIELEEAVDELRLGRVLDSSGMFDICTILPRSSPSGRRNRISTIPIRPPITTRTWNGVIKPIA